MIDTTWPLPPPAKGSYEAAGHLALTTLPMPTPPMPSATMFCLVCPSPRPCLSGLPSSRLPEGLRVLCLYWHMWLAKPKILTMVPWTENICWTSILGRTASFKEACGYTEWSEEQAAPGISYCQLRTHPSWCGWGLTMQMTHSSARGFWLAPSTRGRGQVEEGKCLVPPACPLLLAALPESIP